MIGPITETEHGLTVSGTPGEIMDFVQHMRRVHHEAAQDMPQTLHDLTFKLEVALQHLGILDQHFNVTAKE